MESVAVRPPVAFCFRGNKTEFSAWSNSMQGYVRESIIREIGFPGVTLRDAEIYWKPNMFSYHSNLEIHLRMRPCRSHARVWKQPGLKFKLGRVSLLPPNIQLYSSAAVMDKSIRTLSCHLNSSWLEDVTGCSIDWNALNLGTCLDLQSPYIERAMQRLAREMANPTSLSKKLSEVLCLSIAIDIARQFMTEENHSTHTTALPQDHITQIREMCFKSDGDLFPTAEQVASQLGLKLSYLRRAFQHSTDQTLHEFIEEARMARACELLTGTNLLLKQIAFQLGYSKQSSFSYAFRHSSGQTPSQFRFHNAHTRHDD